VKDVRAAREAAEERTMVACDADKVDVRVIERCRERGVVLPTFAQLDDPSLMPAHVHERLRGTGMQDLDPVNLFRITWRNEPRDSGGLFNDGNHLVLPPALTGVEARIVALVGRWFPTGAHKVGAGFGCLVPRLVTGAFDPTAHKAVWPSTGNFCRGGAFDCALLGCDAVAILPREMSAERFAWLREIGAEVIATPGGESNVKEIYDACREIRRTRPDCVIFNQFEELGNAVWHHRVTGPALRRAFDAVAGAPSGGRSRHAAWRCAAFVSATGSAGTIAAGDFLKSAHPSMKITAAEALQCPTLLRCGHGDHAIEGIGDKHVPWIHNVRSTDIVCAIDDRACLALLRLFNEPAGRDVLRRHGVDDAAIASLGFLGISSICNMLAAIKTARHCELGPRDVVLTIFTDSTDLYRSRLEEMRAAHGPYDERTAWRHLGRWLEGVTTDHMRELDHWGRRALHDLKYFTWVEQQGRTAEELEALWDPEFWERAYAQVEVWDRLIESFNERVGAIAAQRSGR
jgi:cysteine synthase